jgi:hypothetical protein
MTLVGSNLDIRGALTNKISSFRYRPWDLTNITFRTPIKELFFGNTPTSNERVLQKPSLNQNDFWLTDVERYSFDSLKRQRLLQPFWEANDSQFLFLSHTLSSMAILGRNLEYSTFSLIQQRVDKSILNNQNELLDLFSSNDPLSSKISVPESLKEDQTLSHICYSPTLVLDTFIQTQLSPFKYDPYFKFLTFGKPSLPDNDSIGDIKDFNNLLQFKVSCVSDIFLNIKNATLVISTMETVQPIKAIYDFCAELNCSVQVSFISLDNISNYRYSCLVTSR